MHQIIEFVTNDCSTFVLGYWKESISGDMEVDSLSFQHLLKQNNEAEQIKQQLHRITTEPIKFVLASFTLRVVAERFPLYNILTTAKRNAFLLGDQSSSLPLFCALASMSKCTQNK